MGAHGIPPHVAECTTQRFKDRFTDSKIAQKFSFSHSKQGFIVSTEIHVEFTTSVRQVSKCHALLNINACFKSQHNIKQNSIILIAVDCSTIKNLFFQIPYSAKKGF